LAEALAVPFVELDGVFHQAGWTRLPPEEFERRVELLADGPGWVMDGNYSSVRPVLWTRADTVVYPDATMATMLWRLIPRTLHRSLRHTELWNGNREKLGNLLKLDPEVNLIVWSVRNFDRHRRSFRAAMVDPQWSDLTFVRLCSPTQVEIFLKNAKELAPCEGVV
jgi:hypothetical protein